MNVGRVAQHMFTSKCITIRTKAQNLIALEIEKASHFSVAPRSQETNGSEAMLFRTIRCSNIL